MITVNIMKRYGTKANKGAIKPSTIEEVLNESEQCGKSVKRDGIGYSYWMYNCSEEIEVGAGKYPSYERWNGFHNIDIDLKSVFNALGYISTKRSKDYPEILNMAMVNKTMSIIKEILDYCLKPFYVCGFVTGSTLGFNYVCSLRVDDENDYFTEENYNRSYNIIIDVLKKGLSKIVETNKDTDKGNLAQIMLDDEKVIDTTSGQPSRMKFCGIKEHWFNTTDPIVFNKNDYETYQIVFANHNEKHVTHIRQNGLLSNIDTTKIDWKYETRLALGYSLPIILGSKKAAYDFVWNLNIPDPENKGRKEDILNIINSWSEKNYKTHYGEEIYLTLLNAQKEKVKVEKDVLTINQYLTEKTDDVISLLNEYKKVGISAGTGFGKTYMVFDLAKKMNMVNKRVVFLTPLNSIAGDVYTDSDGIVFDVLEIAKAKSWKFVSPKHDYYDPYNDNNKNIVAVYDSGIYKLIDNIDKENTILVIDESHTILTTGYRNEIMSKMLKLINEWDGEMILLSATPNYEFSKMNKVVNVVKENNIERNAKVFLYNNNNDQFSLLCDLLRKRKKENNLIVYYDTANKKLVKDIERICYEEDKYFIFSKPTPEVVEEVRQNKWYKDCEVLFLSAFGQYGINLYPKKKTDVVIISDVSHIAIQAMSRIRNYDMLGSIKIFKGKDSSEFHTHDLSHYWNGTRRSYSDLVDIYNILKEFSYNGCVNYDNKKLYDDENMNKFSDFVDGICLKSKEISEFQRYASMNNINLTFENYYGRIDKMKKTIKKIKKENLMNELNKTDEDGLLNSILVSDIRLLKRCYHKYIKNNTEFKCLFDELDDEIRLTKVKRLDDCIRLSCHSDKWYMLMRYTIENYDKFYLWQTWMGFFIDTNILKYDDNTMEYIINNQIKDYIYFCVENRELIKRCLEIRHNIEKNAFIQLRDDFLSDFLGHDCYYTKTTTGVVDSIVHRDYEREKSYAELGVDVDGTIKNKDAIMEKYLNSDYNEPNVVRLKNIVKKMFDEYKKDLDDGEFENESSKKSKSGSVGGKSSKKGTKTGTAKKPNNGGKNIKQYECLEDASFKVRGKKIEFNAEKGKTYTINDIVDLGFSRGYALKVLKGEHFKVI